MKQQHAFLGIAAALVIGLFVGQSFLTPNVDPSDLAAAAVKAGLTQTSPIVVQPSASKRIGGDFIGVWYGGSCHVYRFLGPEKGYTHMDTLGGVNNAGDCKSFFDSKIRANSDKTSVIDVISADKKSCTYGTYDEKGTFTAKETKTCPAM